MSHRVSIPALLHPQGGNPNDIGRFRTNQPGTHTHEVRGLDRYPTPRIATESLLSAEPDLLGARVWEPAAGTGNIAAVLRDHRIPTVASDVAQFGFDLHFVDDFLKQERPPNGCRTIITNPPYRLAAEFAEHALDLVPDVFLLLRLAFLESVGRTDLLENSGLRRVLVFRRRLPRMHRQNWDGPKASSSMAFGWFAWRRNYPNRTRYGSG